MSLSKTNIFQRWNAIDEAWRFAIVTFVAIRLFYAFWSWAILTIQPLAIQNIQFAGQPILTVFDLRHSQAYTYLRELDGRNLDFRAVSSSAVADLQTGSIWDISTGRALQGSFEGAVLLPSTIAPSEIFPYFKASPHPNSWLGVWQRFDTNWYISLAENGYGSIAGDEHFPPLFPVLVRILKPLFGSTFLAGLFIAHIATLIAIKLLYDLFSAWGGESLSKRATLFLVIYPTSFFLFSAYTESLFLVVTLLSFQQMQKRSWVWAGFWAFCAILTRLQGAALVVPMLYLVWKDRPFLGKLVHWVGLALPAMSGLFYLFLRSRQAPNGALPLVEPDLHARLVPPWQTYWYAVETLLSGTFTFIDLLNWVVTTLFIFLIVYGWRKIPLEYSLYTAFSLLIILTRIVETQPLNSMSRYSLMLFPAFFTLGQAGENPWLRRLIMYGFIALNLYLSAQFFLWGWVA